MCRTFINKEDMIDYDLPTKVKDIEDMFESYIKYLIDINKGEYDEFNIKNNDKNNSKKIKKYMHSDYNMIIQYYTKRLDYQFSTDCVMKHMLPYTYDEFRLKDGSKIRITCSFELSPHVRKNKFVIRDYNA